MTTTTTVDELEQLRAENARLAAERRSLEEALETIWLVVGACTGHIVPGIPEGVGQ